MKSATGHPAIAGALIHFWGPTSILACDLSLQNFDFKVNSWSFEVADGKSWVDSITMDDFMKKIHTHCMSFVGKQCDPFAGLQLVSWAELSQKLGLPADLEVKVASSPRHTIYRTATEYIKVMLQYNLTTSLLRTQNALRVASLPEEHRDMMCNWQTIELGPHMWAVRSEDAGELFSTPEHLTGAQVRKFIKGLLLYCLIPPLEEYHQSPVHGDLRPANVTASLRIIDFEFLGSCCSRAASIGLDTEIGEHWEITREQREGVAPAIHTNAWQVGLLISDMFISPERGEAHKTPRDIFTNFASEPVPCSPYECLKGLEGFLHKLRKSLMTEGIWEGTATSEELAQTVQGLLEDLEKLPLPSAEGLGQPGEEPPAEIAETDIKQCRKRERDA